jgi:uncharacterized protein YjdB
LSILSKYVAMTRTSLSLFILCLIFCTSSYARLRPAPSVPATKPAGLTGAGGQLAPGINHPAMMMKNDAEHGANNLFFIENKGQITDQDNNPRPDIQFKLAATGGLNVFIGNAALHYQFSKADQLRAGSEERRAVPIAIGSEESEPESYTMYRMDVELVGADKHAKVITEQKQEYYENYYTPGTGENGAKALAYKKITYKEVYPHIDWVLYTRGGRLKHEFVVRKGGRVSDIQLKYGGATGLKINADGSLGAKTPMGIVTEEAPVTSQADGKAVTSSFKLGGNILSYETGGYEGDLIIDPGLVWATFYGGTGNDRGWSVATDGSGYVYMAGSAMSPAGIATIGAYQVTYAGSSDFFLAKFDAAGVRQWATYYGGTGQESGSAVATDGTGNVYVSGYSYLSAGMASPGAYQTVSGGGNDGLLVKFDASGMRLWATYYGGAGNEVGYSVATDIAGNVFMGGYTASASGIASPGAYQTTYGGGQDAYVVKFDALGARLWATYYGGPFTEWGYGLATDGSGNVYLGTETGSVSGISSPGAYQTSFGGGTWDAFLVKFDGLGIRQWATYYGGTGVDDAGWAIATDGSGNVYLAGETSSTSGIATPGAYQTVLAGGHDAFLVKFDALGARLWATYYGGPGSGEYGFSVTTDGAGNVYLAGITASPSGIATAGAYQSVFGGGTSDAFLAKFDGSGIMQWATYYGAADDDRAVSVAVDGYGNNIYLSGTTQGPSFVATPGAFQTTFGGGTDAFLCRFVNVDLITGDSAICLGTPITLSDAVPGGTWSSASPGIASVGSATGIVSGIVVGTSVISYTVGSISVTKTVTVNPQPSVSGLSSVCALASITLTETTGTPGAWSSSNTAVATVVASGVVTGAAAGTAMVSYTATAGCYSYITVTVIALPAAITGPASVCAGFSATLSSASGGGAWYVSPSAAGAIGAISSGTAVLVSMATAVPIAAVVSYSLAGCGVAYPVTINLQPVLSGPHSVCRLATITLTETMGAAGTWTATSAVSVVPVTMGTGAVTGITTGTGTITYTTTAGGCTAYSSVTVNPIPAPITGTLNVCQYATTTLSDADAGGVWSSGSVSLATVGAGGIVTGVAPGSPVISYAFPATTCYTTATVTVLPVPAATIAASGPATFCAGGSVLLTTPTGYSYQWYDGGIAIPGATGMSYTATTTGTITVRATTAAGCSSLSAGTSVFAFATAFIDTSGSTTICQGNSVMLASNTSGAAGTITYQWQRNGVNIPGATAVGYAADTAGVYTCVVNIVTGSGSCSGTTPPVTVTVRPLPVPVIHTSGTAFVTDNHGYASYQWYINTIAFPGATTWTINPSFDGSYWLKVTDVYGCVGSSNHLVKGTPIIRVETGQINAGDIMIYPNPASSSVSISSPIVVRAMVTSIEGKTLIDQLNATVVDISNLASGLYFISVYNEDGERVKIEKLVKE